MLNSFYREYISKSYFSEVGTKKACGLFQDFVTFMCNKDYKQVLRSKNTINSFKILQVKGIFTFLRKRAGA